MTTDEKAAQLIGQTSKAIRYKLDGVRTLRLLAYLYVAAEPVGAPRAARELKAEERDIKADAFVLRVMGRVTLKGERFEITDQGRNIIRDILQ